MRGLSDAGSDPTTDLAQVCELERLADRDVRLVVVKLGNPDKASVRCWGFVHDPHRKGKGVELQPLTWATYAHVRTMSNASGDSPLYRNSPWT